AAVRDDDVIEGLLLRPATGEPDRDHCCKSLGIVWKLGFSRESAPGKRARMLPEPKAHSYKDLAPVLARREAPAPEDPHEAPQAPALRHGLHHLLHLQVVLQQLVDFRDVDSGAGRDAALA